MNQPYTIRAIRVEETAEARYLIYQVAHELMEPERSLEEVTAQWEVWGAFSDLDDLQKNYFENGGVFLVTVSGNKIVGTGAFWHYADEICELKRIALLPSYQGQGLGYAMIRELLHQAQEMGYIKMCLWTNPIKLPKAVDLYHRLGFVDVYHENMDDDELWMEIEISKAVYQ
jgi:GNAT superfamily N-acetyltransferase